MHALHISTFGLVLYMIKSFIHTFFFVCCLHILQHLPNQFYITDSAIYDCITHANFANNAICCRQVFPIVACIQQMNAFNKIGIVCVCVYVVHKMSECVDDKHWSSFFLFISLCKHVMKFIACDIAFQPVRVCVRAQSVRSNLLQVHSTKIELATLGITARTELWRDSLSSDRDSFMVFKRHFIVGLIDLITVNEYINSLSVITEIGIPEIQLHTMAGKKPTPRYWRRTNCDRLGNNNECLPIAMKSLLRHKSLR